MGGDGAADRGRRGAGGVRDRDGVGEVQFEVLPFKRAEEEAAQLAEQARLTVTSSPRQGLDRTVDFAARLAAMVHTVTPHLAARMVRDEAHLEALLERLDRASMTRP